MQTVSRGISSSTKSIIGSYVDRTGNMHLRSTSRGVEAFESYARRLSIRRRCPGCRGTAVVTTETRNKGSWLLRTFSKSNMLKSFGTTFLNRNSVGKHFHDNDCIIIVVMDRRGVSPVVSTTLVVAIVVILAATISVAVFDTTENINEPAPNIAESSGEFVPQDGTSGGIVKLTHISGDSVEVSEIEISVRAECEAETKQGRIVNLPAGEENAIREQDGQIEGDVIFDERSLNIIDNEVDGVNDGGALLQGGQYTAGDTMIFRIPTSDCELTDGSEASVQVIHNPSDSVIIDQSFVA